MLNRRDAMMRVGQVGLGALTLPGLLQHEKAAANQVATTGRAKSCIYVFLWGGPPQQDMWDVKPDAPAGIRSEFSPIQTRVPGIHIADQMPLMARHADKICFIRSLTHPSTVHEPSCYHMLTGKVNNQLVVPRNHRNRTNWPNVGSVLSYFTPPGNMPASVTIPRPIGHDGVTYAGTYSGWLGPRYDPMELREAPMSREQPTHAMNLAPDLGTSRLLARRGLLTMLEEHDRTMQNQRAAEGLTAYHEQAHRMLTSPVAREAFNLDREPSCVRDHYGRNEYGESFLLARRLVEAGVRTVSIIWMYFMPNGRIANVWDVHGGVGGLREQTGFDMLRAPYCIPPLDRGYSALLEDLSERGLLDETLVAMAGEFGRTPQLNPQRGREHWGPCQTALLAGGGVRGGTVYGSSDRIAAYPRDNPVSVEDFLATIYHAMGIAPDSEIRDREGRPVRICDGRAVMGVMG